MPDQDDIGPTGPVQPPGYDDISIEFVETPDGDAPPPTSPVSADLKEPETGILEISVEPEEHATEGRALELETQVAKLEDQILRRRADFENYRRRQDREREELRDRPPAE
jgi:molecular chaperone GrpE